MPSGQVEKRDAAISLVLIEDNRLLREGIVALLREQPDFTVLAAPESAAAALKQVRQVRPRVVLLDCGLAASDSVGLTATLHAESPEVRIVGMGLLPVQEDVRSLVEAGASAFVLKNAPIAEVLTTIRAVAAGVEVESPSLTLSVVAQSALRAVGWYEASIRDALRLTSGELRVVALAGEGQTNSQIASRLRLPLHTVRSHLANVMEKLTLRTRLEEQDVRSLRPALGLVPLN